MPFGLKNARATYLRLVDKSFQKQIGRNLEVYVDDMVIKSRIKQEIIRDIEETFKTLREINMKLNLKKCTFGIEVGMFLGYKVNTKGIKVYPNKVETVLGMPSPKCLKDVQRLNGKLSSLNRFLAKSAEKSLPFYKTLKKCTKKSDFQWSAEAEVAFRQMKKLIAELPTLTAPTEKEELIVYLATTREAVSAVLMTKREAKQMSIYFVSRALQGPEINYTPMEKRTAEIEYRAGEYDIHYRPRISIKGKILANSIVEHGFRAKLILTDPEGTEFTYALRFRFNATNNEAEYEALITGLRIAEQMRVKNLQTHVDSHLVANQVNGSYIAKEPGMEGTPVTESNILCITCRGIGYITVYVSKRHELKNHLDGGARIILKLIQDWDEKQIKPWSFPELLLQLFNDSRTINEILKQREEKHIEREQAANLTVQKEQEEQAAQSFTPYWNFPIIDDDDEYTIQYKEYLENSIIPEKESDEFIKSSVEDLVPIPSESEDILEGDSDCDLPSCDDFSPINILEGNSVTFSNPLFDSNNDFTSSDEESLSDEDVPEDNVKIYSNPLFKFDDEYISSDVNPLFDEVLEDIESKDSYVPKLDESDLLVTPLFDANEDECFDPGGDIDKIDAFLDIYVSTDVKDGYHDSEGDIIYLERLLINNTFPNLPSEVFLDHEPRSLKDEPNKDGLKSMVKVFDPGIYEKKFSPTYVRLSFEDRLYLSLTYVIRIFLPYFTYPVDSPFLLSSGSEDTIFDPDISAFHFSFLEPVVSHRSGTFICLIVYPNILNESPMEICSSTCFIPNITMIWGESS
ncbi:reverse transcriptase domain-containing protein [Tanacetum coccineum]